MVGRSAVFEEVMRERRSGLSPEELLELQEKLSKIFKEGALEDPRERAVVQIMLGSALVDGDDNHGGEQNLTSGLKNLEEMDDLYSMEARKPLPKDLEDEFVEQMAKGYNTLSTVWSGRVDGTPKQLFALQRALFIQEERFGLEENRSDTYTYTMFFLGQVLANQGDRTGGAKMCVRTLKRQRKLNQFYEPFRWAKDVLELAQLYIEDGRSRMASHLVSTVFRNLESIEKGSEGHAMLVADANKLKATLFCEILRNAADLKSFGTSESGTSRGWLSPEHQMMFDPEEAIDDDDSEKDLPIPLVESVVTFESARECFNQGSIASGIAKEYYIIDGFVGEHVEICKTYANLYKFLACFENDAKRYATMQSRRERLLAPLLENLNKQIYSNFHIEISSELCDVMDMMFTVKKRTSRKPTKKVIKSWNGILEKKIAFAQHCINTIELRRDTASGSGEDEEDVIMLTSYLRIASAKRSMLPSKDENGFRTQAIILQEAVNAYEKTIEVAKRTLAPDSPIFKEELRMCQEIIPMLLHQISNERCK